MSNPPHAAWVISDGAAGNERQALALASALDVSARVLALPLRAPWAWFAPRRIPGGRLALAPRDRAGFEAPWPDVAIGCGRSAALLTRMLRDLSGGTCYSVQILDPRIDPRHWDAVVAPRHDRLEGANVLHTLGSLNPVDDTWLASGREAFLDFGALPQPRVALLIGGPRRGIEFDAGLSQRLLDGVRATTPGGSVLATVSRRTPPGFAATLRDALAEFPGVFWNGDGTNPYPGLLGWADRIIVTPDSVNMLSEACATGVPVHSVASAPLPDKIARFHAALRERGLLTGVGETRAAVAPLRETQTLAAELRKRIAARTM
ncbi:MAG: mitochondrial fission ELM1 family protein [Xanthomonadales bacterium]|nr:mitochondrial fission ELM1 family protein [Xanthomonadales bacterium]ODU92662.1 MAG: nucleoside-diphosphate sugar epimerase [Rhodanobacter sp. SCN 66-43]OJY85395.1 MAG: nucleoside-diphosphate sugar epimerase [Xanthomonadales bacterium 66-474]